MTSPKSFDISPNLAQRLIDDQFPEFSHLSILSVEKQGHDNRTYRLGDDMLIRMPTAESYALKVPKEQKLLPCLAPHLTVDIPVPLKMGVASAVFPFPFSIYKWLNGKSADLLTLDEDCLCHIALDLAKFLKELQAIDSSFGPLAGQHNWWRGDHVSVYDKGAREQIAKLSNIIDTDRALDLWDRACKTKWNQPPVWIHGDFASGNILIQDDRLSAVIDFGGMGVGDPACDLVIAWTFLKDRARELFIEKMAVDEDTWLRAKAWALWKATFELSENADQYSANALLQKRIIEDVLKA